MTKIRSIDDLNRLRQEVMEQKQQEMKSGTIQVILSLGSCGIAAGALETLQAFQELLAAKNVPNVHLWKTGCNGQCQAEPLVWIITPGQRKIAYANVTPERAVRILDQHLLAGKIIQEYVLE